MKRPNITPGEWKYDRNGNIVRWSGGGDLVARVKITDPIEGEANARLICSATDMIDALIDAYVDLHIMLDDHYTEALCNDRDLVKDRIDRDGTIIKMRAALTKAGVEL